MRAAGCAALAAALCWLCLPARAEEATVTIVDELIAQQEDELIAVYGGGRLLGTLHVDLEHRFDSFETTLPAGTLDYTLCGHLRQRGEDGQVKTYHIDNTGHVPVQPGVTLRAYTLFDVLWALEAPDVLVDARIGPACDPQVS